MTKTLGQIVTISKGKKHSIAETISDKSSRYIQIEDLRNNLNLKYTDDLKGVRVTPKDILIAWDGANAGTIGYNLSGKIGSTLARLRLKDDVKINPIFLGKFLESKFEYLRKTATGATIPHINRKALEKIEIPNIDLVDQQRIAQVLTDGDNLIAKRKECIALLDDLVKSTFFKMFGDPLSSKSAFKKFPLSKLGSFKNGLNYTKNENGYKVKILGVGEFKALSSIYDTSKLPCINLSKLPSEEYFLQDGDVVFVRSNGNKNLVGRSIAIYPKKDKITFSGFCIRFRPHLEKINPIFLTYLFKIETFKNRMLSGGRGANITNLNQKLLGSLKLPLPPLELQEKFAQKIHQIKTVEELQKKHLKELQNLYGRLSQDAFKGNLNLSRVSIQEYQIKASAPTPQVTYDELDYTTQFSIKDVDTYLENKLKNNFKNKEFTFEDLKEILIADFSSRYNQYDYDKWKNNFFGILRDKDTYLTQFFDKNEGSIKFKISDEIN